MFNTLADFYKSKEFEDLKTYLKAERMAFDGLIYCEHCHKPMIAARDIIAHHVEPLTLDNVNDMNISLNPDNIQLVHFRCHNEIHNRFGVYTRHVYLVYGSPLSGKSSFVKERADIHDLIIDIDRIYECISNNPPYIKSKRITENVFAVRDCLLEQIKMKRGKWVNAFVISGMPYKGERERFCAEYGAESIYIETTRDEAYARLQAAQDGRNVSDWMKYIDTWFDRFQP